MARPTKLTPDVHAKIVGLLRAGNYVETAAAAAGVDARNVRRWLARGARGEEPFAQFARDVDAAQGEAEARDVIMLGKAAESGEWRAAAFRLERRHPERWGQRIEMRVKEQAVEQVLDVLRTRLDPETYERVLAALAESEGEPEATGSAEHTEH